MPRRLDNEKNLPTEQPPPCQDPRLPQQNVHQGGEKSALPAPRAWQETPGECLIPASRLDRRFPKTHRITQRAQFQRVYRFGRRIETAYFVLYCLPNDASCHRLGITASKKMGNAVLRNRLKRIFREVFRNCPLPGLPNLDIIVNTKRSSTTGSYQAMEAEFRRIIQSIEITSQGS
jgi:ribonuclease P protein component